MTVYLLSVGLNCPCCNFYESICKAIDSEYECDGLMCDRPSWCPLVEFQLEKDECASIKE